AALWSIRPNASTNTEPHHLPLHDALPISATPAPRRSLRVPVSRPAHRERTSSGPSAVLPTSDHHSHRLHRQPRCSCGVLTEQGRSEEHTSELQSRFDLVCRLLLEKKNRTY